MRDEDTLSTEDDVCSLCNGTGVIIDSDGDEQECDECDGTGVLR